MCCGHLLSGHQRGLWWVGQPADWFCHSRRDNEWGEWPNGLLQVSIHSTKPPPSSCQDLSDWLRPSVSIFKTFLNCCCLLMFLQLNLDTKGWLHSLKHRWMHCDTVLRREPETAWKSVLWIFLSWHQHLLWVLCKDCKWLLLQLTQITFRCEYLVKCSRLPAGSEWPVSVDRL